MWRPLWRSLEVSTPSFRGWARTSTKNVRTGNRLKFSGEAVHKGLSPASLLPTEAAKHEIPGYNRTSDPASSLTFFHSSPHSSLLRYPKAQIALFHKTSSILSVITMKPLLALSAFLAIAATEALAAPNPAAAAEAEAFCNYPGQPCYKLKRLAAALAEPIASAEADAKRWCYLPGQACLKNKRDASASARAWCRLPGQFCTKVKRQLEELEAAFKAISIV